MLKSMTAFARCHKQGEWGNLICEIRTVNSRYLDLLVRMPEELRDVEMKVRDLVRTLLTRGKLEFSLRLEASAGLSQSYTINHGLLKQLKAITSEFSQTFELKSAVSPFELLRWPGVLQETKTDLSQIQQATLALCEETCLAVIKTREKEGLEIQKCFLTCLEGMEKEIAKVSNRITVILETQKERLLEKIRGLQLELDEQRLEHEMLYWAQKLDVQEELQRLDVHIKEVRSIVMAGGVVGRRLDFLMQELNREANTLGSKSADILTTQVSVELKVLIEQMREQVQNIE